MDRTTTTYEFVVETLDFYEGCADDPDIIDTTEFRLLKDAILWINGLNEPWRIALRRDTGNDMEGLLERFYAYPDVNGKLPERFEDLIGAQNGPVIPARFKDITIPKFKDTDEDTNI